MQLGIIGAGHAGVEAAVAARAAGVEVTLFSNEATPPYFRPRLVAVAMGQATPDEILMHPAEWYAERGIALRRGAPVEAVDATALSVSAGGVTTRHDALVLACGATPLRPTFPGETPDMPLATLWSLEQALAIARRVRAGGRLAVIGGGILGLECALRAAARGMRATVIEKQPRLLPLLLGAEASALLQSQVAAKGVDFQIGRAVAAVEGAADGVTLRLDDGAALAAELVLVCIGARPNLSLARQAGLAVERGVLADAALQARPGFFVAGDVCQVGTRPARGAAREAAAQGRAAGGNAAAWLTGKALTPFVFETAPAGLRYGGVEIWSAGCVTGEGAETRRLEGAGYRAVTRRAGVLVGVQMVGTREGFDDLVGRLGKE
jgi:nitrite reductase (NADH) large subunit